MQKMKFKKVLVFVVALVILLTISIPANAVQNEMTAANILEHIGILLGAGDGVTDEYLQMATTRAQGAVILLRLMGREYEAKTFEGTINFEDVIGNEWFSSYTAYLKANPGLGFVGYPDGTFRSNNIITGAEMIKVLLTVLGYMQNEDYAWAEVIEFAADLGLTAIVDGSAILDNKTMAEAIWEVLNVLKKDETHSLAHFLISEGVIDIATWNHLQMQAAEDTAGLVIDPVVIKGEATNDDKMEKDIVKIYGLNFSPYTLEGQNPNYGTIINKNQIRELIKKIAPYTKWVRTFGCTGGLEHVGQIAREFNMKVAVGAWLGRDMDANEEQIEKLIRLAKEGQADMLIVGSEVLLRRDLSESVLIDYINRVKEAVPDIPVTTAEVYGILLNRPAVIDAVDVIFVNYYPYWEGIHIEKAISTLNYWHQSVEAIAKGKMIIVSETGWPSDGNKVGNALPSLENAAFYFLSFVSWATEKDVPYFYFEAFDEPWKAGYEGPQGAYWGIWDKDGNLKEGMQTVFQDKRITGGWDDVDIPGGMGSPSIEFTVVPPYGSTDYLKGQVRHVKPTEYRIAVYIKVSGKWWTKPTFDSPLTYIDFDGSWSCNIVTGGFDREATQITAYLLPVGYDPPAMRGNSMLPAVLDEKSVAKVSVIRTP